MLILFMEVMLFLGVLSGIGEIVKEVFGDDFKL